MIPRNMSNEDRRKLDRSFNEANRTTRRLRNAIVNLLELRPRRLAELKLEVEMFDPETPIDKEITIYTVAVVDATNLKVCAISIDHVGRHWGKGELCFHHTLSNQNTVFLPGNDEMLQHLTAVACDAVRLRALDWMWRQTR